MKLAGAVVEGLTEDSEDINKETVDAKETNNEKPHKKMSIAVSLSEFKLQLFMNEPQLVITNNCKHNFLVPFISLFLFSVNSIFWCSDTSIY